MLRSISTLAAGALLAASLSTGAGAATTGFTFGVTEGNEQNRDTVFGTTDLNIDTVGPYDLGTLEIGDTFGIYGRIVSAVDRFEFTFESLGGFEISFDLDGYFACLTAACVDTVEVSQSGLINQNLLTNSDANGGKEVEFRLKREVGGNNEGIIATTTRKTNLTSANADNGNEFKESLLFSESLAGTYTLVIDGKGSSQAALYDLLVTNTTELPPVPLPAGAVLLLTGIGGFAAMRRRKKA